MRVFRRQKTAYTLIELSISLVITSLLMAGIFSMINGSIVNSKVATTNEKINTIYKALGTYLMVNRRLPCPASIEESVNTGVNFGKEVRAGSGNCSGAGIYASNSGVYTNLIFGLVPTQDLKLSSEYAIDDFGNKISYIIDQRFTGDYQDNRASTPVNPTENSSSFGTASLTNLMTIKEKQADSITDFNLTTEALVVIMSHGSNGFGSFNINDSSQNPTPPSDSADEISNTLLKSSSPNFDNVFYAASLISEKFDDILVYKTRSDFISDFDMQNLIPCFSSKLPAEVLAPNSGFTPISLYNGQYLYADSDCSTAIVLGEYKPRKALKCVAQLEETWQWVMQSCP